VSSQPRQSQVTRRDDKPDAIETSVQKTYRWLRETEQELRYGNPHDAYLVLRAFLHVLRDRLTVNEAADLGAQLPMLIRGIYYEAFVPSRMPQKMRRTEFLARFAAEARLAAGKPVETTLRAPAKVLLRHITPGEAEDVLDSLPAEIRDLIGYPSATAG
jgi:uncharacterized protein (DUF2267 family)